MRRSVANDIDIEPFIYALVLIYSDVIMCHRRHIISSFLSVRLAPFRHVIDWLCSIFVVSGNTSTKKLKIQHMDRANSKKWT